MLYPHDPHGYRSPARDMPSRKHTEATTHSVRRSHSRAMDFATALLQRVRLAFDKSQHRT